MTSIEHVLREEFAAAAVRAAAERPDVDPETAREVMAEAAEMLHNSLALDSLEESDAVAVVRDLPLNRPLPIGIVTAMAGTPLLLWLVSTRRRRLGA